MSDPIPLRPGLASAPDEQLVARLRAGDETAFTAIVERHARQLTGYARRLLAGSGIDPEDLVQEAFVRAYLALGRDDRPMALRAWLHCVVRNCVLDELRRRTIVVVEDSATAASETPDAVEAREALTAIFDALAELPIRQRQALVLRVLDDRPYAWIARELDTSLPGVKALISRARRGLRAAA
jgi:RNA polymerase sigma-70 factor (ECF subfamily)